MHIDTPFHPGELFVQRRANEAEIAQRNGGVIADAIPKGVLSDLRLVDRPTPCSPRRTTIRRPSGVSSRRRDAASA